MLRLFTHHGRRSSLPMIEGLEERKHLSATLKGGLLNQGLTIRAMYPLGAGDEEFLAAAEAAADDTSLMAYARNQLRSNSFVLGRILAARRL